MSEDAESSYEYKCGGRVLEGVCCREIAIILAKIDGRQKDFMFYTINHPGIYICMPQHVGPSSFHYRQDYRVT